MEYHVFLSFRGEDTRPNFTTHLRKALKDTGMNVFYDEDKLKRGEQLWEGLSEAIAASKLSIIILSANYADSKSCLAELYDIMDRKRTQQHMVLPIFYKVDSSDVQNPDGSSKKFFVKHKSENPLDLGKVERWEATFLEVGTLDGIYIKEDISEAEQIKHIVNYAINKLMKVKLKHQVLLSLGEDTRHNFTSHLLKALVDTGINVFSDKGEQSIAAFDLTIIVLSKDYASSETCLAQLSDIMHHKSTEEHVLLPIFYHVDPSDVRNLKGSFKASFNDHESKGLHQLHRWKAAFKEVGKLKGWHIEGGKFDRPDNVYIKEVVEYVTNQLNRKSRSFSKDLVGIDDQKETILRLVEHAESRIIGLWGMGGIGKTRLAEAVYNEIFLEFQSRHFLQNVREKIQKNDMESVRNEALSKLLLDDKIDVDTPSIGSTFIQDRLKSKRVIVVLDDVSDSEQSDCMGVEYFGDGSKIIVTSRDRQVLKNGGVDKIYEVKKLNEMNSLQLFSTFAFKLLNPTPDFRDLSNKFLDYAQGSPLALKVLGSKLQTKSKEEWESEVDKLKKYQTQKISKILKSSFDELDKLEKNIFLDIACFIKWESREDIEEILSCSYEGVVCGISSLHDKSLIEITKFGLVSMHDMLEEMGKEIVGEHSKNHGRLWNLEEVNQVLKCDKVNESIQGIKLTNTGNEDRPLLCSYDFKKMPNVRYLYIDNIRSHTEMLSLPNELRYLRWDSYPFNSLSLGSNSENLAMLKLFYGTMEQFSIEDHQGLANLRTLDVYSCPSLRNIPNLSGAVNLERVVFGMCRSLVEFPELPNSISVLDLTLSGIKEVPDSIQHLSRLRELSLRGTMVEYVSENISKLESLCDLELGDCNRLMTLSELPRYLFYLAAYGCTSLEKVSFTDRNSKPFHSLHDGDDAPRAEKVLMLFSNCRSLNQESIRNIRENAMIQIQSLIQRWARWKGASQEEYNRHCLGNKLFCCFPGNEVPASEFCYVSKYWSLNLRRTPSRCNESGFLAFAICLVADLTYANNLDVICKYQLATDSGEKFTHECYVSETWNNSFRYNGDHVFILFNQDMIIMDRHYEKASFDFYFRNSYGVDEIKVEKCGVHIFYVGAESYAISEQREWRVQNIE